MQNNFQLQENYPFSIINSQLPTEWHKEFYGDKHE